MDLKMPWFVLLMILLAAGCSKGSHRYKNSKAAIFGQSGSGALLKGLKTEESDFKADLPSGGDVSDSSQNRVTGRILLKVSDDSSQIYYTIRLNHAHGVIAIQLRYGKSGGNGYFIARLYPRLNRRSAVANGNPPHRLLMSDMMNKKDLAGVFGKKSMLNLIHAIQHDSVYVQVFTKKHPQGAVRRVLEPAGR